MYNGTSGVDSRMLGTFQKDFSQGAISWKASSQVCPSRSARPPQPNPAAALGPSEGLT